MTDLTDSATQALKYLRAAGLGETDEEVREFENRAVMYRPVHHSTILEMNVESYRRRAALDRKRGRGRAPTHATIKDRG